MVSNVLIALIVATTAVLAHAVPAIPVAASVARPALPAAAKTASEDVTPTVQPPAEQVPSLLSSYCTAQDDDPHAYPFECMCIKYDNEHYGAVLPFDVQRLFWSACRPTEETEDELMSMCPGGAQGDDPFLSALAALDEDEVNVDKLEWVERCLDGIYGNEGDESLVVGAVDDE